MITINSLSGGKTSCFMSLHFPADYDVFALVEMDAAKYKPGQGRLSPDERCAFNWVRTFRPSFWATAEDNKTLVCLHRLHYELQNRPSSVEYGGFSHGLRIVAAGDYPNRRGIDSFDSLISVKRFLPNSQRRTCTEFLKVWPIYNHSQSLALIEPVRMAIGFRMDEVERTVNLFYKMAHIKDRVPNPGYDLTEAFARFGMPEYMRRWWEVLDVEQRVREGIYVEKVVNFNQMLLSKNNVVTWRYPAFPLIENGVPYGDIIRYWRDRPEYDFPVISNCVHCFHHRVEQLQTQWQSPRNWGKMEWASDREEEIGALFGKNYSYRQIEKMGVQQAIDFNSSWTSCDSGGCTD